MKPIWRYEDSKRQELDVFETPGGVLLQINDEFEFVEVTISKDRARQMAEAIIEHLDANP